MARLKKAECERLNLVMPPRTKQRIEEIQDRTGDRSMTEVIRRALAIYAALSDAMTEKSKLYIEKADGERLQVILTDG